MRHLRVVSIFLLAVLATSMTLQAAEWGSLKGRFVYDGKAPTRVKITPSKDVETCGKHELFEETIWVDSNGGLANVLIYLYTKRGKSVDVHSDYDATKDAEVAVDNKGCRFDPHITLLRTTQTLVIKNSDPVGHNTNCKLLKNAAFNEIIAAGQSTTKSLTKPESIPSAVSCNIHPWMQGYLVVRDNPYMTLSADDGSFEIKNIPTGEHEFGFWHESPGNLRKLDIGGETTSRKGRIKLKIPAGETLDLGDVKIAPKSLKGR